LIKGRRNEGKGGEGKEGREQEEGGKGSKGRLPPLKFKSGYALGLRVMSVNSL